MAEALWVYRKRPAISLNTIFGEFEIAIVSRVRIIVVKDFVL
jgi:hypothetical protein